MRWARLCAGLLSVGAIGAYAQLAWRADVDATIASACGVRGLAASAPLDVRPMVDFQGGYTAGVGNIVWEQDHAERWRAGWCALGAYCVKARAGGDAAGKSPMQGPAGLFDVDQNVLYVRDVASADAQRAVAHEATHALQYQNYPALRSVHLWYNRDLAAAANAATEGDAHIVGTFFDDARRRYLCSMAPNHATANRIRSRGWQPHALWAYEGFPHVFGPERALEMWLAGGDRVDDWLREPPLATIAVLRPERPPEVDFIDLGVEVVRAELAGRDCVAGLANTAGALGIWGLLVQHGNADAALWPAFIDHWRGDRFLHIACAGDANDEFAWVSRWHDRTAASEFAAHFRAIAAAAQVHGEVLDSAATAFVKDATVVVATPALHAAVPHLAAARVRTFSRFSKWVASGCFPQDECYSGEAAKPTAATSRHLCAERTARPARFDAWLGRIRSARAAAPAPQAELDAALAAAGELAKFCAVNRANNADWAQACRAAYYGIRYQAQLRKDPNWQLLPHCASEAEMRDWYRATYYADAERPSSGEELFHQVYGPALAGRRLAEGGIKALAALAADPPLSTLAIFKPGSNAVDFMRLPHAGLAALGCKVAASSVQGVLSTWHQLLEDGASAQQPAPPAFLFDWQGDRQVILRCAEQEGWISVSRWASEASARTFAASAASNADSFTLESGAGVHTVWISPPALAAAKEVQRVLREGLEVRSYSTFAAWRADGCFPQADCN